MEEVKELIFKNGEWVLPEGVSEGTPGYTMPVELTEAEDAWYKARCEMLAKEKGVPEVHACVQIERLKNFERIVSYYIEPNFATKLRAMGVANSLDQFTAANELREATLIREASNPLTYGDTPECDPYKIGAVEFCLGLVRRLKNQFKKK